MIKLFKKDLRLFIKDKRSVIITFLLPIILMSLFAFAFGGIGRDSNEPDPVSLLVSDQDSTPSSKMIIAQLDSLKGLKIDVLGFDEAKEQVGKGNYPGVLILYDGLEDSVKDGKNLPVELLFDKAREMEIGMLQPVLISTLMLSNVEQNVTKNIERYLRNNFPDMPEENSAKILRDIGQGISRKSDFIMGAGLKTTS